MPRTSTAPHSACSTTRDTPACPGGAGDARWLREQSRSPGRQRPRHAHGRHDRGADQRHRHRGCGAEGEDRRAQGRQRRRVLLPGGRDLRLHVGGHHGFDVTNNSYFADPWLFNCKNDPEQRAIWEAERRALKFAMGQGVTVVAAAGNQGIDLTHPTHGRHEPRRHDRRGHATDHQRVRGRADRGSGCGHRGGERQPENLQSFYSRYGIDHRRHRPRRLSDPAADRRRRRTAASCRPYSSPASRPRRRGVPAAGSSWTLRGDYYAYLQGDVDGLAARGGRRGVDPLSQFGHMHGRARWRAMLRRTADPDGLPAPTCRIYAFFPAVDNGAPQVCTGGTGVQHRSTATARWTHCSSSNHLPSPTGPKTAPASARGPVRTDRPSHAAVPRR